MRLALCSLTGAVGLASAQPAMAAPDTVKAKDAVAIRLAAPRDPILQRQIGQLVMVGFHGRRVRDREVQLLLADVRSGRAGGVIVMDRNITRRTKDVGALTRAFRKAAITGGQPTVLLGVDQEGGFVQRIRARGRSRYYPSAWRVARDGRRTFAERTYIRMANQLAELGFNLNFGPVVDLRVNPRNPIIARKNRSYGRDPVLVTGYARTFVDTHRSRGILTSLKHFPGHGSAKRDSHLGFVDISRVWSDEELQPYAKMFASGHADTVMVGHLFHEGFSDNDTRRPATLAKQAVTGLLREELGYKGVVITDDLAMGAIRRNFSLEQAVTGAVVAGNDIILITSERFRTRGLAKRIGDIIYEGVLKREIPRARIAESYARVIALKAKLDRLQASATRAPPKFPPPPVPTRRPPLAKTAEQTGSDAIIRERATPTRAVMNAPPIGLRGSVE